MIKRVAMVVGLVAVAGVAAACSAAPVEEGEETATESQELPKCEEPGLCGAGDYEPYYPYDYGCATGETKWNSGVDCDAFMPCTGGTGCSSVTRQCTSSGCGTPTNSPSTNPCYGKWVGCACTLSGGYPGLCGYNSLGSLVCKP